MKNKLLDLDVGLLILRYGRRQVVEALARVEEQSAQELGRRIKAAGVNKKSRRARPALADLVAAQVAARPEIGDRLRLLGVGFQNRTFLPHLRDARRFLERVGEPHSKLKSRSEAEVPVIRALGRLSAEELGILTAGEPGNEGEFDLLARAIMGTPPSKPPGTGETD